jgi:hypothetical protein
MTRDAVKTVIGLVIIAAIVVATFLYGNAQRKSQAKQDQAARQQTQTTTMATGGPSAQGSGSAKVATNTAPVESPQANTIQGGKTPASSQSPKPSTAPKSSTDSGSVAIGSTPQTGGTGAPLPQTGPSTPLAGVFGMSAIAVMLLVLRRSRRAVLAAARRS